MTPPKKRPSSAKARTGATRPGGSARKSWTPDIETDLKDVIADHGSDEVEEQPQSEDASMMGIDAPLVRLVNSIIHEAAKRGVSDIHIEPFEGMLRVRFRIDGVLEEVQKIPHKLTPAIVSRIKIMADLDICEKRIPQDGVINFRMEDMGADLRVSTLPSAFGEKIVMRVLGTTNLNNDLSKLGIPADQLKLIRSAVRKPTGLVLVTGPTGSGKTTTLYAALNELNDISVSVFTAEDPVEGNLPGVTQCQVNSGVGYTFSSILRALLRQDPDVILVGEIRDKETAEIAIKASLTGHLVLSTLHTNCSVSTIQRLADIGIKPYLITSSVNCIVAQRLVRRICEHCKEERQISPEMLESLEIDPEDLEGGKVYHGKGCDECHGAGFKGRAPVYEVLVLNDDMRKMILKGAAKVDLKNAARSYGMRTLRESAMKLVSQGITTIEEALGRTAEDEDEEPQVRSGAGLAVPGAPAAAGAMPPQVMQQMMQQMMMMQQQMAQQAAPKEQTNIVVPPADTGVPAISAQGDSRPAPTVSNGTQGIPEAEEATKDMEAALAAAKSVEELAEELEAQEPHSGNGTDESKEKEKKGTGGTSRWKRGGASSEMH